MIEYPKIQSVFKRDDEGYFTDEFSCPEFKYLYQSPWEATEKIDGTNIRVDWDGEKVTIAGRTDKAQIPTFLHQKLEELFPVEKFKDFEEITLFGEGYGNKIQKGFKYSEEPDFILFDVLIGKWWLQRTNIIDISMQFGLGVVPDLGTYTLVKAIYHIQTFPQSTFGNFPMEGMVLKNPLGMLMRSGHRIITKIKCRDF